MRADFVYIQLYTRQRIVCTMPEKRMELSCETAVKKNGHRAFAMKQTHLPLIVAALIMEQGGL